MAQAVARGAGAWVLGALMAVLMLTRLDEVFTAFTLATALVPGPMIKGRVPGVFALAVGLFGVLHASLHGKRVLAATLPQPRILEFGDGMLNAALSVPVRHGFVFAGDVQNLNALREGRLLADAAADGFNVIASQEYLPTPPEAMGWSSAQLRDWLAQSALDGHVRAALGTFDFRLIHRHAPSEASFIAFWPRGAAMPQP